MKRCCWLIYHWCGRRRTFIKVKQSVLILWQDSQVLVLHEHWHIVADHFVFSILVTHCVKKWHSKMVPLGPYGGHKPTKLAHSFLFCSSVCFCLYDPFNCISVKIFSKPLSTFWIFFWSYFSLIGSLKVSLSPDIILCGWLGLNHRLTNTPRCTKRRQHFPIAL